MRSVVVVAVGLVLMVASAGAAAAQSYDDVIDGFEATMVDMNVGKMTIVRIGIEKWSTPEDRQAIWQAFQEGGSPAVGKFLSEQEEKGFVKFQNTAAYKMYYAYQFENDGKRVVVMATDRPNKMLDLAPGSQTGQANLTLLKLVVDAETGKGEGTMIAAAELTVTKDGKIGIDAVGTQPIQFTKVVEKKPKKK